MASHAFAAARASPATISANGSAAGLGATRSAPAQCSHQSSSPTSHGPPRSAARSHTASTRRRMSARSPLVQAASAIPEAQISTRWPSPEGSAASQVSLAAAGSPPVRVPSLPSVTSALMRLTLATVCAVTVPASAPASSQRPVSRRRIERVPRM